jgi:hypothetical protein
MVILAVRGFLECAYCRSFCCVVQMFPYMVPRPTSPPPRPADWSSERTHAALKKQLAALEDQLRGKNHRAADDNDERGWSNLTENILAHGFGEDSNNVRQFKQARNVGQLWAPEMGEALIQEYFDRRVEALSSVVQSSIAELEWMLPQPEIAGSYNTGDEYAFYRDLKTIVGIATKELFIVDNYLDTQLFDIYMENVNSSVTVRVLTDKVLNPLKVVAEKFSKRGGFELRSSKDVHDRVVFVDDRCWVIGQSIKDAAKKKPTYIVEHSGAGTMKGIYESIWAGATTVVKG